MARAQDVARLFIEIAQKQSERDQGEAMTNLRLQKLLYFAQGWHMARYGKPLFEEKIEAWKYGPVVPSVYSAYNQYGPDALHDVSPAEDAFTEEELGLLMDVIREYWKYSGSGLVNLSHAAGTPWDAVYRDGQMHIEMKQEDIEAYFRTLVPLRSMKDVLADAEKRLPVIEAKTGKDGAALLPAELDGDWGDWDE